MGLVNSGKVQTVIVAKLDHQECEGPVRAARTI